MAKEFEFIPGEPIDHEKDQEFRDKKDAELKDMQAAIKKRNARLELINPSDSAYPLEVEEAERLAEELNDVPDEDLTISVVEKAMEKLGIERRTRIKGFTAVNEGDSFERNKIIYLVDLWTGKEIKIEADLDMVNKPKKEQVAFLEDQIFNQ